MERRVGRIPPRPSSKATVGRAVEMISAVAIGVVTLGAVGATAGQGADGLYAELHTGKGTIVARLEPERAPLATASFVGLAEGTIENDAFEPGRPFYDGTVFHRVVRGHVIQAGRPQSQRAAGPGYTYPNEIHASLSHDHAGALGVANAGPHTNGAQFYVTLGDRGYLDGDYIVFGEVIEGMDVVRAVAQGDTVERIRIVRVGDRAAAFRPDTASFRAMVQAAERRVAELAEVKAQAEAEWIARRWPEAAAAAGPLTVERLAAPATIPGADTAAGRPGEVRVEYRGTAVRFLGHLLGYDGPELVETRFGSGDDGEPGFFEPSRTFAFEPGRTTINPGLDRVLAEMAPGERWVVVVPPDLAYGRGGFYGPNRPDVPRFVISPNTMLVYDVRIMAPAADRGQKRGGGRASRPDARM